MKKFFSVLSFMAAASSAFAGGLVTNTNQNAAFLRQMSQDATIDITSLYLNPAGTAFLNNGWHLSLNIQNAKQRREIETQFPLFAYNQAAPGETTHDFVGKANAPVIPSFQLSYNHDKWSVNANFALGGGGGKCEFDKGLGSFEALYSGTIYQNVATAVGQQLAQGYAAQAIPQYMAAGMTLEQAQAAVAGPAAQYAMENLQSTMSQAYQGYSMDAYMKGRQYYFGLQLGATYKFTENLAGFVGLRGVYATTNYNGYVQDVKYTVMGNTQNANSDLTLNCDQTGFGITPIVGLDWRINKHWNVAAKYEFKTKMRLENTSEMNEFAQAQAAQPGNVLGQFADGKKVAQDIPGILGLGAQYSPIEKVRLNAGFHLYLDQDATTYGNKQEQIEKNSWELTTGAEWDICKYLTISGSWQRTKYGMSDAYMNDLSFNLSNNSLGVGFRVNATERCHIDFGYMHTFYQDMKVATTTAAGVKNDKYHRTNRVFGLGVNLDF